MKETRKWWAQKWYWTLCIVSTFFGVLIFHALFFPGEPLDRPLSYAVALSVGVFLTYIAYVGRLGRKQFEVRTLWRIIFIMGGVSLGLITWSLVVIPLVLHFQFGNPIIVILLLFVLVIVWAYIADTIMKRRDHQPFM